MALNYAELQQGFLRRQHVRIAIKFPSGTKLLMLHLRATVNDVYRQLDVPRMQTQLYTDFGMAVPRSDEYCTHFFNRVGVQPWTRRPQCFSLICHTVPLHDMLIAQSVQQVEAAMMLAQATQTEPQPEPQPEPYCEPPSLDV